MKKILGIIILGLLLSGCTTHAPEKKLLNSLLDTKIKVGMGADEFYNLIPGLPPVDTAFGGEGGWAHDTRHFENYAFVGWVDYNAWDGGRGYDKIFVFEKKDKEAKNDLMLSKGTKIKFTSNNKLVAIKDNFREATEFILDKEPNAISFLNHITKYENSRAGAVFGKNDVVKLESKTTTNITNTVDINFTIKDKKEQCTAIGFEPATEKFADCVLRLVELDVKSQQATQIALAQSQGNQQVANQLKKQRNDQSSQYFLDLGQKLLNPQSTVSAPSTSTCRVTGGIYKTVSCW
jgi:hypothetical protein